MADKKVKSPLLGYNTNVKHAEEVFHIQTEDSGVDHPHIITHLFTSGTILATKKRGYGRLLADENWEDAVRQMMKDQHKEMFVELRDGLHDCLAARILGRDIGGFSPSDWDEKKANPQADVIPIKPSDESKPDVPAIVAKKNVQVIAPAKMTGEDIAAAEKAPLSEDEAEKSFSIFETPDVSGSFGESLISDKSLDEVILTYLQDELEE